MRSLEPNSHQKAEELRKQIRRKQIQQLFSTHRHELPLLSRDQSTKIVRSHFKQLEQMLREPNTSLFNNYRLQIVMKELRDINCDHQVPQLFHVNHNLHVLVELANCRELDRICQVFLYEILLNVSSMRDESVLLWDTTHKYAQHSHLPLEFIRIEEAITDNKGELMELGLKIMGNMIEKDKTSKTIYYLLTKVKVLKLIIKILIDRKEIYQINKLEGIVLWFSNKIINTIAQFKFQKIDNDYSNFVAVVGQEIMRVFELCYQQDHQGTHNASQLVNIDANDVLVYIKTTIKVEAIQLDECLIAKIERYFGPTNLYYIDLLGTLTCRTLYSLPLQHLEALLDQLLSNPGDSYSPNILRCISNSLINDGTDWKTVLMYFIQYSQTHSLQYVQGEASSNTRAGSGNCGFLMYFLYFLNCSSTQKDMAEIIGTIICGQSGLGIFQTGIPDLIHSSCMMDKLSDYGFDFEIQL